MTQYKALLNNVGKNSSTNFRGKVCRFPEPVIRSVNNRL